jgi:hypothetical protein
MPDLDFCDLLRYPDRAGFGSLRVAWEHPDVVGGELRQPAPPAFLRRCNCRARYVDLRQMRRWASHVYWAFARLYLQL